MFGDEEAEAPAGAAAPERESTRRPGASPLPPRGSSNSRPRCRTDRRTPPTRFNRDRPTPPSAAQAQAIRQAIEEGRCRYVEGERLTGFLWLGPQGQSESTVRRRVARLLELGVPGRTEMDDLVDELVQLINAGEISYEEAETRAGRFILAQLTVQRVASQ